MTTPRDEDAGGPRDRDETAGATPIDVAPDDIFAAAVGTAAPSGPDDREAPGGPEPRPDLGAGADADDSAGTSVYPSGPPTPNPMAASAPVWGTPRLPPPGGGQGFERRASHTRPEPDEFGYYPDDYYLAPNWPRLFAKLVVAAILLAALTVAGLEISDRFAASRDDQTVAEPTPTPSAEVAVYECAGDADPVAQLPPPGALLIAGRTADSRWLAFRNPEPPPLQLWVEARDVPTFVPSTVGIVSCAAAPDEFPTPR